MNLFKKPPLSDKIPLPADEELASRNLDEWFDILQQNNTQNLNCDLNEFAKQLRSDPVSLKLLNAIFGNSPYLTQCIHKAPEFVHYLFTNGPSQAYAYITDNLAEKRKETLNDNDLAKVLRIAKRQVSLAIAIADICDVWPLTEITGKLSDFASQALSICTAQVLTQAATAGAFTLANPQSPEEQSGLIILGMGKLGARELNYSSDIDLIIMFDPDVIRTDKPDRLQNQLVRLTRNLVKLMDDRTADGYVFRTDLRLRPDPSATPLAVSIRAAEAYYESLGQNWERAAMIKARPVAGDIAAGERFLKWLTPFIWRKNFDFAAIQDIHSIKRQINVHRGGAEVALAGHNVKLGAGGIREIEFFAQTQQLIWGGREAILRTPETIKAVKALTEFGLCEQQTANDLIDAYDFLRRVEHRIQMINDEQTHLLPEEGKALQDFSIFLGYADFQTFSADMLGCFQTVKDHYTNLFAESPSLAAEGNITGSLVFTGTDPDPDTMKTLRDMGYQNPETVDSIVRGWHHGRHRSTRSLRAREILTELMPVLLSSIASTTNPDTTFLRFEEFLAALPSGVQLFAMFHSNPELLKLVAEIMGEAPRLASHLSRRPSVLDCVLAPDFYDPTPGIETMTEELETRLQRTDYMEEILNATRRWSHDRRFQVGVQQFQGLIEPMAASQTYSDIAEVSLSCLYPRVYDEFKQNHGEIPGGEMALLGFGKLGSQELTATSDLDMVFVYKSDQDVTASNGKKPLSTSQYFSRLSQRLINAVTARTPEGILYELDMRLRPAGNSGPIACTTESFRQYYHHDAWTWEHMALTRCRVIVAGDDFKQQVETIIADNIQLARKNDEILRDVSSMRQRLVKEKGTDCIWSLKQYRGGLVDIEFIAQYMTIRHAHTTPEITRRGTAECLNALGEAGFIAPEDVATLTSALHLWQKILGLLALALSDEITNQRQSEISGALADDLIVISDSKDLAALEQKIQTTANEVYQLFVKYIEQPANLLPPEI